MKELVGFLKREKGWQLSSVAVDSLQRKVLKETKYDSKASATTMYVRECLSHKNTPLVRISLFTLIIHGKAEGRGGEKVGEALACPLCWKLMRVYEESDDWKLEGRLIDAHSDPVRKTTYGKVA